ncbi:MAG: LptF/LptG family permease [bacterium]|nr:LptF/LptG family permease [bacterium]
MKILPRYLMKEILHYFVIFTAMFVVVLLVYEIYDMRDDFIEKSPALVDIVRYLIYSLPAQLGIVLPIICLLTTMFAYGLLAKNREILAMVAAGVSFRSLAVPVFLFGVFMVGFSFWFIDRVAPAAQFQAVRIEKVVIGGKSESVFTRRNNLFVKGSGNRFYLIKEYLSDTREMVYPSIFETRDDGSGINERIEADYGKLVQDPGRSGRTWEFAHAQRWLFNDDGSLQSYQKFTGPYRIQMEEELGRFLSKSKMPEQMNFNELKEHIRLLRAKGGEDVRRYSTWLQQKLAFPVACLLMALLGYSVVVDVHARRFARGVTLGLLLAIAFFVLNAFLKNMGDDGSAPPVLAGWLPVAAYLGIVSLLMTRLNRIRG